MKCCKKILLLCVGIIAALENCALADSAYIGSVDKTTIVKAFEGDFEVIGESDTNGIAVTKDGYLIISAGAVGSINVSEAGEQSVISVAPCEVYDFEEESDADTHIKFSGERKELEDGTKCSDKGILDVSYLKLTKESIKLSFDFMKADTEEADLIMLSGGESVLSKITLNRRNDEQVYLSYIDSEGKTVRLRNNTYSVGEWYKAEVGINLEDGTVKLNIGGTDVLTAAVTVEEYVSAINFGTHIDNLTILSGEKAECTGLEISIEEILIPEEGIHITDPMIKININGTTHDIAPGYVSFVTEGTGIMPSDGVVSDDEGEVTIKCSAIVSGEEYKALKTVPIKKGGEAKEPVTQKIIYEPVFEDGKVKLRVVNCEGMNLKVIVQRDVGDGAMDYIFEDRTIELADDSFELHAAEDDTIYLIDTSSRKNLLEKEGV